jgi:two-component system chemotaxis response regulator CheY
MSGQKILIVDDSTTMRMMVRNALEIDRHQVVEAPDGRAALRAAEAAKPDLVITDVNMPEMDGLTLVRALRDQARYRFTPILVLTTEGGDAMKQRGREAGATGWLVKPFDPDQLRQIVRRVTRSRDS